MTGTTTVSPAELLVELERLGVTVTLRGERLSLRPGSVVPADLLEAVREQKPELIVLLADPRTRWRTQAETVLAEHIDIDRADLLDLFAEREAIASVEGGLDDDTAGRLAYHWLLTRLGQVPIRSGMTGGTDR
ncbi:MAG: hypothetical protein BIFFINMI_03298 [Phycisphaerae bacterium]|nr:hypothetical protein [Phycisphaerae bacterium]